MIRPTAPILSAALLVLLAGSGCGKPPSAPSAAAAPKVPVITVAGEDIPADSSYVGRTVPNRTVNITSRVTGTLLERPYQEGSRVEQGAVLFKLDPREFEAARDSAKARLAQTEAQVVRTAADLARTEPLAKAGAAAQSDLDAAIAAALAATADRDAARAALAKAELDLSFTVITAPFTGLAGKATVDPGTQVSPGTGTLALIDEDDPIAVEFTVSEAELVGWRSALDAGRYKSAGVASLLVKATLVDGTVLPTDGRIGFRDVRIRPETGTALIRAIFPNTDSRLRAGQFIRLSITGVTEVGVILVPQTAVLQSPQGASVYIVDAAGKAEVRPVTVEAWRGDRWVVREGLKAGDRVITDGLQRVRPGSPVEADAATPPAPAAPAAPAPATGTER
jgi:membrane fusion protein (multidrug efflux system)